VTSHLDHAAILAELQRTAASALHEVVGRARRAGICERDIAAAIDPRPAVPEAVADLIAATAPATSSPLPRDRFVGRDHDLAELRQLITRSRLVTLTGPPGVGKTRLALELLKHRDVRWVDLTSFTDAQVAGLAAHHRGTVLVLDTCEHVLKGCAALVTTLLAGFPRLLVVATSREALRIDGEAVHVVSPLEPAAAQQLFTDRGGRGPVEDADGLPLAIELAARQAPLRTAPERQQTVEAAVRWSYDLLDEAQQRVLRALAAAPGGFDGNLADVLCGGPVWTVLRELRGKSLLEKDSVGRYRMLEVVRQFALERLRAAGEQDEVHARLVDWAADFAEEVLLGDKDSDRVVKAENEECNLRHIVSVAEGHPRLPVLGAALAIRWTRSGEHRAALRLTERMLALEFERTPTRSCLLSVLAGALNAGGKHVEALVAARESLALASSRPELMRRALGAISRAHSALGNHHEAARMSRWQVTVLRELDRPYALAVALNDLAWALVHADAADEASAHVAEALDLFDGAGEAFCSTLHTAGAVALVREQFDEAALYFTISLSRTSTDADTMLHDLEGLGVAAIGSGSPDRGLRLLGAAMEVRSQSGVIATPWWAALVSRASAIARDTVPEPPRLDPADAVSYALQVEAEPAAHPLTERELQVAQLVAKGLTDQQIAARLHVSPRTAAAHLAGVRAKLGLPTRVHVAVWVAQMT
jgi:predicted ATPase/DNA-binding CsgD family transcriptional regulator